MKIPKDKLPLSIGHKMMFGQYSILSKNPDRDPDKFPMALKHSGMIASKDLSQYVVKAANEFPEALSLIKSLWEDANMALDGDWDRSDEGFKAQIELIEKFLNKLEDDNDT